MLLTDVPKKPLIIVLLVVVLGLAAFAFRSYQQSRQLRTQLEELQKTAAVTSAAEVKQVTEAVGKLMELPADETPTLATISDREKLKDLPFFARAENGDKVLMYVNTRKAILYRPNTQKIIDVATLNLSPNQAAQTITGKLALRNGTTSTAIVKTIEDNAKRVLPKMEITSRDTTAEPDLKETVVVDLTGNRKADAEQLARLFGGKVSALPGGEGKPVNADFLVLLGADILVSPSPAKSSPSPSASPIPSASVKPSATP